MINSTVRGIWLLTDLQRWYQLLNWQMINSTVRGIWLLTDLQRWYQLGYQSIISNTCKQLWAETREPETSYRIPKYLLRSFLFVMV
jgi:hypothetical protein